MIPDFEGDKEAVTQYDEKAELYAQELEAVQSLIEDFEWAERCPGRPPASRDEAVLTLIEYLGEDLVLIHHLTGVSTLTGKKRQWNIVLHQSVSFHEGQTLILALCAAVRAKMEAGK